jgi:hypothetical protein
MQASWRNQGYYLAPDFEHYSGQIVYAGTDTNWQPRVFRSEVVDFWGEGCPVM